MSLERRTPTPRAQRILRDIGSLTVRDVVWLNRELRKLLGRDDDEGLFSGVREPRRPTPPDEAVGLGLELPGEREHW